MRYSILLLLAVFGLVSAQAVEQPNPPKEHSAYPQLTMQGLEDYQLGTQPPSVSSFPGLVAKSVQEEDWDDNGRVLRTTLKFYHQGFYLGQGMLDKKGRLVELELSDWRAAYQDRFAAMSTWKHVRSQLSDCKLHYAYELDALVAESSDLPGLQVHFEPNLYKDPGQLQGAFTPLDLNSLPGNSKAKRLRLFWIPDATDL